MLNNIALICDIRNFGKIFSENLLHVNILGNFSILCGSWPNTRFGVVRSWCTMGSTLDEEGLFKRTFCANHMVSEGLLATAKNSLK